MKPIVYAFENYYAEPEIKGSEDNPAIVNMFYDLGYNGSKLKDETAWCAAFANHVLKQTGYLHTGQLNARSFLQLGGETDKPSFGDLVIFWRGSEDSWQGHVGFFVRERKGWTYVLGGNQSNQVNVAGYPTNRVLGYRKPKMDWGV